MKLFDSVTSVINRGLNLLNLISLKKQNITNVLAGKAFRDSYSEDENSEMAKIWNFGPDIPGSTSVPKFHTISLRPISYLLFIGEIYAVCCV